MNEAKICPKCGSPQQWEMWRMCSCGFDFGPPSPAAEGRPGDSISRNRYRTFWKRYWAGVVDGLVFVPISLVHGFFSAPERGLFIVIAWAVIHHNVYWLYSVILHARWGQTLGKMATHVQVLDLSEERIPTLRQAFLRDIGVIVLNTASLVYFIYLIVTFHNHRGAHLLILPGQILGWAGLGWFLLEIVSMATNDKRRALHDYIAGTVVVREVSPRTGIRVQTKGA